MSKYIEGAVKLILVTILIYIFVYLLYLDIIEDDRNKKLAPICNEVIKEAPYEVKKMEIEETEEENNEVVIEEETKGISDIVETKVLEEDFDTKVERLIFEKINEERKKRGLQEYSNNPTMAKYAKEKSKDMGDNKYFNHRDLAGNLITVKMKAEGVRYTAWAENIAWRTSKDNAEVLADEFVSSWMNSSGHRANILSNRYNSTGIGVYKVGTKIYATEEFHK